MRYSVEELQVVLSPLVARGLQLEKDMVRSTSEVDVYTINECFPDLFDSPGSTKKPEERNIRESRYDVIHFNQSIYIFGKVSFAKIIQKKGTDKTLVAVGSEDVCYKVMTVMYEEKLHYLLSKYDIAWKEREEDVPFIDISLAGIYTRDVINPIYILPKRARLTKRWPNVLELDDNKVNQLAEVNEIRFMMRRYQSESIFRPLSSDRRGILVRLVKGFHVMNSVKQNELLTYLRTHPFYHDEQSDTGYQHASLTLNKESETR